MRIPCEASLSKLGVLVFIIPWLYAPILNQPTSSPMMTTILGLVVEFDELGLDVSCARAVADEALTIIIPVESNFKNFCRGDNANRLGEFMALPFFIIPCIYILHVSMYFN